MMRRFNWSRVLIVLLCVALLSLGGCGGGGGGSGARPAPNPEPGPGISPKPNPAPGATAALDGAWDVHDGSGSFIEGGRETKAVMEAGYLRMGVVEAGLEHAGEVIFGFWSKFRAPGKSYDVGDEFNGRMFAPVSVGGGRYEFALPGGTQTLSVHLTSANEGEVTVKGQRRDGSRLYEFDVVFSITRQ